MADLSVNMLIFRGNVLKIDRFPRVIRYYRGAQIDLLIDKNDDTINLCEMKYTNAEYTITEDEDERIRNRKEAFIRETETEKTVLLTMITSFGLTPGGYSNDIHCQLTMADLFSKIWW